MGSFYTSGLSLLLVGAAIFSSAQSAPTLTTTHGDVNGFDKEMFGMSVDVFYGIPYAKAPIGDRRFRAPEAADPWVSEAIDGTDKPHTCWQTIDTSFDRFEGVEMWNPNTEMNEDCLYLNVYRRTPEEGDEPKTIMVWIHGGGFSRGSPLLDLYNGSQLAVRENVIVVTIAYRLGPLGFLQLEDNLEVQGNAGLLDQVMALQWVKDNAVNLGGSPDDINIFGQEAGAASVGFHLMSPLSRDLFKNAIMQSGSPTSVWAVRDTQKNAERVKALAESVACPFSLGDQLLPCLRSVDPEVLTDQQLESTNAFFDVPIGPIVDGTFLPKHPEEMLRLGDIKRTNVVIGVVLYEGIYWAVKAYSNIFTLDGEGDVSRRDYRNMVLTVADNDDDLQKELLKVYSREHKGANKRRMRIVDSAVGDGLFKCSVIDFAREYTLAGGRVYLYSFEEKFSSNPWPGWMGVPTGSEIEAVFGLPVTRGSLNTQAEKDLNKEMMDFWASFAKKGVPKHEDNKWPIYTNDKEDYVKIDSKGTRVARRLRKKSCELWSADRQLQ